MKTLNSNFFVGRMGDSSELSARSSLFSKIRETRAIPGGDPHVKVKDGDARRMR